MLRKRFAVAKKRTALVVAASQARQRVPVHAQRDARTSIAIARALPGRRSGKRCVKPRKGLKRRCTRYVVGDAHAHEDEAGSQPHRVHRPDGGAQAEAGRYRATVGAVDAAGNRAKPAGRFRMVRR